MPDRRILSEWLNRGAHDISAARLLFENNHYTDTIAYHIHQAMEKYLKGFLLFQGWKLKKIHDLEELLTEALEFQGDFSIYLDFARKVTAYYIEDRYPPGPPQDYPRDEIGKDLEMAEELIEKIKKIAQ
jgi:HEPN domain-containing protein